MVSFKRIDIKSQFVASLCWFHDDLIDLSNGGVKYHLDGTMEEPDIRKGYAYPFDSIRTCDSYAAFYDSLGTKGVLIDMVQNKMLREINRSYYYSKDYRYPIDVFELFDGRQVIAHCPEDYCALELELIESGEIITKREQKSSDVFHSDLMGSLNGLYLLDRGWVWHPWNIVGVYDLKLAVEDPSHLAGNGLDMPQGGSLAWEANSATICGHHLVTSSCTDEYESEGEEEEEFELLPALPGVPDPGNEDDLKVRRIPINELTIVDSEGNPIQPQPAPKRPAGVKYMLQVYDLITKKIISSREMPELVGRMMPLGNDHIVSFYDHPKVIEIETGKVILHLEDLSAGPEQDQPSTMIQKGKEPYLAMDPKHNRFAIGTEKQVTIVIFQI